ncbi:MAG: PfkB family carbohydrate kinase [Pseudomonadota bacterium]
MSQNTFIVFGRAGMDFWADPVGTRSTQASTFSAGLGGSAANIAVGLVKLGGTADLLTSVSDDAVGWFCLNQLRGYGVGTDFVRRVGGEYRTSLAVYESVVEDFQNVIYRNSAADFQVTTDDALAPNYTDYGVFISSGTAASAEPSRSALFAAIEAAKSAGLPVVFDVDYRPYSWPSPDVASEMLTKVADASDIVVGNDEEFDFMAGGPGKGLAKAQSLARPGRIIVYKMGGDGAVTFADGQVIKTGIYNVEPVKPNGAGDSFMAGFLAGLAEGRDLKTALLRGSAAAAIVVSNPGCAPPLPDGPTLDAFIAAHPGPTEP